MRQNQGLFKSLLPELPLPRGPRLRGPRDQASDESPLFLLAARSCCVFHSPFPSKLTPMPAAAAAAAPHAAAGLPTLPQARPWRRAGEAAAPTPRARIPRPGAHQEAARRRCPRGTLPPRTHGAHRNRRCRRQIVLVFAVYRCIGHHGGAVHVRGSGGGLGGGGPGGTVARPAPTEGTVKQLKAALAARGVDTSGMVEKAELVAALEAAGAGGR